MLGGLLSRYDRLLITRPLVTKVASATLLSIGTDVTLQRLTLSQSSHDIQRTARQAAWSGPIMAPTMHAWMNVLAKLPAWGPLPAPVVSLAVDTFTLMPFSHVVYVAFLSGAEHGSTAHIKSDIRAKLGPLLQAAFVVIPPVMLINLWLVPLRYRVFFLNVTLGVGYGGYLNWLVNRASPESAEAGRSKLPRRDSSSYS